jgi:hypothetical protein
MLFLLSKFTTLKLKAINLYVYFHIDIFNYLLIFTGYECLLLKKVTKFNCMSNVFIILVGSTDLTAYWPQCEPLIERGLEPADGEANAQHVWEELVAQRAHLLVGVDGANKVHVAIAVQFMPYPNYKVAHVYSIGGRGVIENAQHWAAIKDWMKQQGATKVQGVCRPAQARLWQRLGFRDTYHVVRQDL